MVEKSFASLVKTNNGKFKSEAQAKFLLSQCRDGQFITSGHVHGNLYTLFYVCDNTGVVRVEKQTNAKGLVTQWERREEGKVSVQDQKEIKRLKRLLKGIELSIKERRESVAKGEYASLELAAFSEARDLEGIKEIKAKLVVLEAA